jgi:carbamoyltransferase
MHAPTIRVQTIHSDIIRRSLRSKSWLARGFQTSFTVHGEPIVCTPEDAFRCFMGTDIEALAAGNCYLVKEAQDQRLKLDYKNKFLPD